MEKRYLRFPRDREELRRWIDENEKEMKQINKIRGIIISLLSITSLATFISFLLV